MEKQFRRLVLVSKSRHFEKRETDVGNNKLIQMFRRNQERNNGGRYLKPALFMAIICIFFSLPILFFYDSSIYIEYIDFFKGKLPWGVWGRTRGWGYPLFLWISGVLFGESSYGVTTAHFLLFLVFLYFLGKIMRIQKEINAKVLPVVLFFLFVINPIIAGYFHVMLTEALAAVICIYSIYKVLDCQKKVYENPKDKMAIAKSVAVITVSTVFLYAIKQLFFIIPVLALFFSSFWLVVKKKLSVFVFFVNFCVIACGLFLSIKCWNIFLDAEDAANMDIKIEDTVFSGVNVNGEEFFNAYLMKGAINFKYDGATQTITVYHQDEAVDILPYEGEVNQFQYLYTCFIHHPILLLEGYIDGYGALANLYRIEVAPGEAVSSGKIVRDVSFVRGYENYAIGCYPRYYKHGINTYEQLGRGDKLVQYGQYTDDNLTVKILYSPFMIAFHNFLFTFSFIYAPLAMVWHAVVCWLNRKKEAGDFHAIQFILAGTAFLYGMALSIMCMHIDRYMFPVYAFVVVVLIGDIIYWIRICPVKMGIRDNKIQVSFTAKS